MATPENNVINLRPEAPTVEPERPCWGVYEHWVINEKGRKLRPGVYWHGFKRTAAEDEADDDKTDRPITDEWIATPVTVTARTTNSDDGSQGRLLRLATEGGIKEWIIPMEVFGGSGEDARRPVVRDGRHHRAQEAGPVYGVPAGAAPRRGIRHHLPPRLA